MGRQGYGTTQQLLKENKHHRKQTCSTGGVTLLLRWCAICIIITITVPRSPSYMLGWHCAPFPWSAQRWETKGISGILEIVEGQKYMGTQQIMNMVWKQQFPLPQTRLTQEEQPDCKSSILENAHSSYSLCWTSQGINAASKHWEFTGRQPYTGTLTERLRCWHLQLGSDLQTDSSHLVWNRHQLFRVNTEPLFPRRRLRTGNVCSRRKWERKRKSNQHTSTPRACFPWSFFDDVIQEMSNTNLRPA